MENYTLSNKLAHIRCWRWYLPCPATVFITNPKAPFTR